MTYYMNDNREDKTLDTEIYPLGLEGQRNSTNKRAEAKKRNMKYLLEILRKIVVVSNCIFIRNILNSWHKHDRIDVTVGPRSKQDASAVFPMLHGLKDHPFLTRYNISINILVLLIKLKNSRLTLNMIEML